MYPTIKRALDVTFSLLLLLALSPLFAIVAIAVALNLGRPVLFAQPRPGLHSRAFILYKFRSMTTPQSAKEIDNDESRLTKFGRQLRKTSLDELPSLWNVLKGEMSFVGPRPLLVDYLDLYTPQQLKRHDVRPGITGLAQVSGRNNVAWENRFVLDVEYVESMSFTLDSRILIKTFVTVFKSNEISAIGHATMPKFTQPKKDAQK